MTLSPADPARSSARPAPAAAAPARGGIALDRVLVIVPAHDEEASLPSTLSDLRAQLPGAAVVVIDDCSTDRTAEIAARAGAAVVTLPCNLGYGGAVQAGFK